MTNTKQEFLYIEAKKGLELRKKLLRDWEYTNNPIIKQYLGDILGLNAVINDRVERLMKEKSSGGVQ